MFGLALSVASTVVLLRALESAALSIRQRAASRSAGWWSKTSSRCWCWCCCRRCAGRSAAPRRERRRPVADAGAHARPGRGVRRAHAGGRARASSPGCCGRSRTPARASCSRWRAAIALGVAYGSAELFGVSFALGAFFAGMVLRESSSATRPPGLAAAAATPSRCCSSSRWACCSTRAILLGEPLAGARGRSPSSSRQVAGRLRARAALRYPLNTALTVAASLAQIGEFSFILAAWASRWACCPSRGPEPDPGRRASLHRAQPAAVQGGRAAARSGSARARASARRWSPRRPAGRAADGHRAKSAGQVVLVGYGRVGRRIARHSTRTLRYVVAEQNREWSSSCASRGMPAVWRETRPSRRC